MLRSDWAAEEERRGHDQAIAPHTRPTRQRTPNKATYKRSGDPTSPPPRFILSPMRAASSGGRAKFSFFAT